MFRLPFAFPLLFRELNKQNKAQSEISFIGIPSPYLAFSSSSRLH